MIRNNQNNKQEINIAKESNEETSTNTFDPDQFSLPEFIIPTITNHQTTSACNNLNSISSDTNLRSTNQLSKDLLLSTSNQLSDKKVTSPGFQNLSDSTQMCCCNQAFKDTKPFVNRNVEKAESIDRWSRAVFPVLFIVFIFLYWTIYTHISREEMLKGFTYD